MINDAAVTRSERRCQCFVGRDDADSRYQLIRDDLAQIIPFTLRGERPQPSSKLVLAELVEYGLIGTRGTVERDPAANFQGRLLDIRRPSPARDKPASPDREPCPVPPGPSASALDGRQEDLPQVAGRVERLQLDPAANFPGDAGVERVDRGEFDGDAGMLDRTGVEVRVH